MMKELVLTEIKDVGLKIRETISIRSEELRNIILCGLISDIRSEEHKDELLKWYKEAMSKAKKILEKYNDEEIWECAKKVFGKSILSGKRRIKIKEGFEQIEKENNVTQYMRFSKKDKRWHYIDKEEYVMMTKLS